MDDTYHVASFSGTHGLGHVRLATESDVKPEAAHPFWATGFADIAIVHNGQITNYWKMRRRLEQRGFAFNTENDSELIAVYLADKLQQGVKLEEALRTSIEDLDGTFSFLVSTKDEIGYAKDNLAVKPMIMYETDDMVAIASEEVSLNKLFPGQALDTMEPAPGDVPDVASLIGKRAVPPRSPGPTTPSLPVTGDWPGGAGLCGADGSVSLTAIPRLRRGPPRGRAFVSLTPVRLWRTAPQGRPGRPARGRACLPSVGGVLCGEAVGVSCGTFGPSVVTRLAPSPTTAVPDLIRDPLAARHSAAMRFYPLDGEWVPAFAGTTKVGVSVTRLAPAFEWDAGGAQRRSASDASAAPVALERSKKCRAQPQRRLNHLR